MFKRPKTLSELFLVHGGVPSPPWLPLYDLDAYLAHADAPRHRDPNMTSTFADQATRLDEYQAIIDLCAAFQSDRFTDHSHYAVVDHTEGLIEQLLRENALQRHPSYRSLLKLMIHRGALIRRTHQEPSS